MSSLIFSSSLTCEFLPKMKKMKMPITKIFCCVLLICGLAVFTTESPANPEFTPNWFPGERWSYPFDGYQIDSTPMQHTFGVSVMSDVDKEKSTSLTSIPMASEPSKTKTEVSEMKNNVKEGEPSEPYDSIAEEPVKRPSDGSTRGSTYDPTLIMMGLGKRINTFYPEHKSVGIHEHEFTDNPLAQKVFLRLRRSTDTGIGEQEGNRISGARSSAKNERTTPLSFSNKGIDVYRDFSVEETEKEYLAPKPEENEISSTSFSKKIKRSATHSVLERVTNGQNDFALQQKKNIGMLLKHKGNENVDIKSSERLKRSAVHSMLDKEANDFESTLSGKMKNSDINLKQEGIKSLPNGSGEKKLSEDNNAKRNKRSLHSNKEYESNKIENYKTKTQAPIKKDTVYDNSNKVHSKTPFEDADREKRNVRQSTKKFAYDPALKYMGLGKRQKFRRGFSSNYDPAFQYMGLGKRNNDLGSRKRESYDPALQFMGLGKRENVSPKSKLYLPVRKMSKRASYDPAFYYMGSGKKNFPKLNFKKASYDPALQYMGLGKRENVDIYDNDKKKSYDPAFKYMGLGKRDNDSIKKSYDPAFQYMGLGKRENVDSYENDKNKSYDPAFQYMGLGKKENVDIYDNDKKKSYDPAFKYMGLGKRDNDSIKKSYDPAFQYMGLGKRENVDSYENDKNKSYDPAFQYMGLGKKENVDIYDNEKKKSYDPAFKYMGLGKRDNDAIKKSYDPAFQYMGLGKRDNDAIKKSYDPAFQYMGLGKRDNADIYETDKKKSYDPAFKYMGLGKRKYAEIGSKRDSYDPAFKYMGLGKRINNVVNSNHGSNYSFNRLMWFVNNPEFIHKELGFEKIGMTKKGSFDPAFKNIAIGKRTEIIRRKTSFDPALKYMGLGKRNRNTNWVTYANHQNSSFPKPYYTNKQNEESKRSSYNEPALHYMGLGKSDYGIQGSSTRDYNVHSKPISYAKANQRIKRSGNYDPALQYMGLGKRDNLLNDNSASSSFNQLYLSKPSSLDTPETSEQFKRSSYYDPALQYMGLGKRGSLKQGKYDPALQFLGLGKRKKELKVAAKMTQSKELDPMSTKFSIPLQNTNYPEFKDDFSTDIRPSKTVFYESKRSKREIEREDTEPDEKPDYDDYDEYFDPEAYPKLHRIDNIDNPHGITIFNGNLSDKHDDFDLVFDYDESPVFADCEGSETPCNEETKETTLYGGSPKKYGDKAKTNKKPFPNGYPIVPTEEKQEMQLPDMETSLSSTTTKPLHMGEELIPHRRPGTPYSYFTDPRKKRNLDEDIFPIVTRTTRQVKLSGKPYPFHNNRLKKRSQVKTHATISSDTDIEVKRSANSYLYVHNHRKKGDLSQVQTPAIISAGVASRINRSDTPYAHHNRNKRGLREFKKQRSTLLKPRFKSPKSNFGDTNPTLMKKLNQKIEVGVPVVKARAQNYKVKRSIGEIDMNRPRYNPGWVFIGLGKRSQGGGKVVQDKVDSRMSLITKCYQLLRKVNDAFRGIAGPRLAEAEPFWMANVHGKNMKGFQNFKKWKNE